MKFNIIYRISISTPLWLILLVNNMPNSKIGALKTEILFYSINQILTNIFSQHRVLIILILLILPLSILILVYHIYKKNKIKNKIESYKNKLYIKQKSIQNIYSHFSDIYFKTDHIGNVLETSPSIYNITGYKPEYYQDKHISTVFAYHEEWEEIAEAMQKKETIKDRLYSTKTKNNKVIICSLTVKVQIDELGNITGYEGILKDFSQRQSAQDKIESLETIFAKTLTFSNTGVSKFGASQNTFLLDAALCKMLGYSGLSKRIITSNYFELIHDKERDNVKESFNQLLNKSNSSFIINFRIKNIDNNYLWFSNKFETNKINKNGRVTEIVGIHTLIENQKNLEFSILDYKRKLHAIYNSTNIMHFLINEEFLVKEINHIAAKYFNKNKTEIIDMNLIDLFCLNDSEKISKELDVLIQNSFDKKGNLFNKKITCIQKENTKYLNVSTNVYLSENGLNCLLAIEDITKQKTFELQTQNKLNILEKREKETISLINKITDEIRNPINGILNESTSNDFASSIDKYKLAESSIRKNAHKIIELIEKINDLAEINTKEASVNIERFDVKEYFNNLYKSLSNHSILNEIELELGVGKVGDNQFINTDPEKLKSLIINTLMSLKSNLDSNKFEIGVIYNDEEHTIYILSSILNQKILIDNIQTETILELAEKINADFNIDFNDSNQIMCRFIIKAPIDEESSKTLISKTTIKKVKILIVEDEEYNIYYLQQILKMAGYDTLVAEDGQKAIDTVKQEPEIDLILMDIRLPGIDGLEASKRIKEINPDIPIIAQTAFNLNSKEDQDMEKYCDDYIQKPILSQKLYLKINNILNN